MTAPRRSALLAFLLMPIAAALPSDPLHPLAPPDTSSPRATLQSFLGAIPEFEQVASPRIPDEGLDAHLLRLAARIIGIVGASALVAYGARDLGIPVVIAGRDPELDAADAAAARAMIASRRAASALPLPEFDTRRREVT